LGFVRKWNWNRTIEKVVEKMYEPPAKSALPHTISITTKTVRVRRADVAPVRRNPCVVHGVVVVHDVDPRVSTSRVVEGKDDRSSSSSRCFRVLFLVVHLLRRIAFLYHHAGEPQILLGTDGGPE
jgi:hypothetical protein